MGNLWRHLPVGFLQPLIRTIKKIKMMVAPRSMVSESGGREGIRTLGLLVANEEKSKLRLGITIT
jgi:hypothetical protein